MKPSRRAALALSAGAALALAQRTEKRLPITPNSSDAVSEWIRRTAIPLSTPVAGYGFDDMAPLKKIVGDARIVALGEATHGTREFFQLKHRMLEFLVTQMGFSIFSIEANMPESYRLNDFVLRGEGDPAKLMKGMYVWLWDTQEVLDMVLWMREYNKSGKGRVAFTGFATQTPTVANEIVRDFVAKTDAEYVPALARASEMALAARNPKAVDPQSRDTFGVPASARGSRVGDPECAGRAAMHANGSQSNEARRGHGVARREYGGQREVDSRSIEGCKDCSVGSQLARDDRPGRRHGSGATEDVRRQVGDIWLRFQPGLVPGNVEEWGCAEFHGRACAGGELGCYAGRERHTAVRAGSAGCTEDRPRR